jgi:hypothetical protein
MTHGGPHMFDLDDGESYEDLARELDRLYQARRRSTVRLGGPLEHIQADEENIERGLAQLVLSLVELLRQLLEKQALRRMENGTLTDDEIERLGTTFMKLKERMDDLQIAFGLEDEDLNIDLGPLGKPVEDRARNHPS